MINNYIGQKDIIAFSEIVNKMCQFCLKKGFVEVNTQDRLSILAACEDPLTVATFNYAGQVWPLPQTGQMWLEYELLTKPELPEEMILGRMVHRSGRFPEFFQI